MRHLAAYMCRQLLDVVVCWRPSRENYELPPMIYKIINIYIYIYTVQFFLIDELAGT